ncbi:hypothetical protein TI04_08770, partial [Achromatium sp. WMS2]
TGTGNGGGVWFNSSATSLAIRLINNIFSGNSTHNSGGGAMGYGTPTLINNSFNQNTAANGGGLALELPSAETSNTTVLANNLFWANTASANGADLWLKNDADNDNYITPLQLFSNNNLDQTYPSGFWQNLAFAIAPSNLDHVNPLFLDSAEHDLHLRAGSPMIDAGEATVIDLPSTDIDGGVRVLGANVDIGADEYGNTSIARLQVTTNDLGIVTSNTTGINCGVDCLEMYPTGTAVVLSAIPTYTYSSFSGWGGACSGTGSCTVNMTANKSVTATFVSNFLRDGQWPPGWITPTTSNASWTVTNDSVYPDSNYSLRSGAISHNQTSQVQIVDNFQYGTVSFARRVSSQGYSDYLRFYVDGVKWGEWAGEVAWELVSYAIAPGTHTLVWAYEKDGYGSSGSDAAWIGYVSLPPRADNSYTVTPIAGVGGSVNPNTPQTVSRGATKSFTVTPNKGYVHHKVTGTCPVGTWSGNTYTTGAIDANCTVNIGFFCDICLPSRGGWRSMIR